MDLKPWIKQAQTGDASAFEWLLEHSYDSIYRYAYQWCGHRSDAEDITQLACLKLAKNLKQFRFEAAFSTWLYRLVINCAKDWQRSQRRHQQGHLQEGHQQGLSETIDAEAHGSGGAEANVYLQEVLNRVAGFGEGYKETLVLVCGLGLKHSEAAQILDTKESTISWRLHEIRKRIALFEEHAS